MKPFITILLFSIVITFNAQVVSIPDINFKKTIIEDYNIDTNNDGEVQFSEAEAYTGEFNLHIDVTGPIFNLIGIEAFTNLTGLSLIHQPVVDAGANIDLSANTNLTYLNYYLYYELGGINVSNNTALETLICKFSGITGVLDLSNKLNLRELDCTGNEITALDISNSTDLEILNCEANDITALNISNNLNLEYINCYANDIEALDVSNHVNIKVLNCTNNYGIDELNLSNSLGLEELSCGGNDIVALDLSNNTQLKRLYCAWNELTLLDLTENILLEDLRCSHNYFTELDLSNAPYLKKIIFDNSWITNLDLSNNPNLEYVRYNNSEISNTLNIANGNNTIIAYFNVEDSPNLSCVFVDDVSYSEENWTRIDGGSHFVATQEECDAIGVIDEALPTLSIYPNPTTGICNLDFPYLTHDKISVVVLDVLGRKIKTFSINQYDTSIDLSAQPKGIYFIKIENSKNTSATKLIKH